MHRKNCMEPLNGIIRNQRETSAWHVSSHSLLQTSPPIEAFLIPAWYCAIVAPDVLHNTIGTPWLFAWCLCLLIPILVIAAHHSQQPPISKSAVDKVLINSATSLKFWMQHSSKVYPQEWLNHGKSFTVPFMIEPLTIYAVNKKIKHTKAYLIRRHKCKCLHLSLVTAQHQRVQVLPPFSTWSFTFTLWVPQGYAYGSIGLGRWCGSAALFLHK